MPIIRPTISVSFPQAKRSFFGKKQKRLLIKEVDVAGSNWINRKEDAQTKGITVGSKLMQKEPKLGLIGKKRWAVIYVDDGINKGFVKVSLSGLSRSINIPKKDLLKNRADATTFTEYVKENIDSPITEHKDVSKGKTLYDQALEDKQNPNLSLLKKAGKANYSPAYYELGLYHKHLDRKKAAYYFKKAAELGHSDSKFELSLLKDKENFWLLNAAADGQFEALASLATGFHGSEIKNKLRNEAEEILKNRIKKEKDPEVLKKWIENFEDRPGLLNYQVLRKWSEIKNRIEIRIAEREDPSLRKKARNLYSKAQEVKDSDPETYEKFMIHAGRKGYKKAAPDIFAIGLRDLAYREDEKGNVLIKLAADLDQEEAILQHGLSQISSQDKVHQDEGSEYLQKIAGSKIDAFIAQSLHEIVKRYPDYNRKHLWDVFNDYSESSGIQNFDKEEISEESINLWIGFIDKRLTSTLTNPLEKQILHELKEQLEERKLLPEELD